MMVKTLLPGCMIDTPDAADALAVAICHAHQRRSFWIGSATYGGGRVIAKLSGTIDSTSEDSLIIDVGEWGTMCSVPSAH